MVLWNLKQFENYTKGPDKIIIRGSDTDIFIILLENVQKLSQS